MSSGSRLPVCGRGRGDRHFAQDDRRGRMPRKRRRPPPWSPICCVAAESIADSWWEGASPSSRERRRRQGLGAGRRGVRVRPLVPQPHPGARRHHQSRRRPPRLLQIGRGDPRRLRAVRAADPRGGMLVSTAPAWSVLAPLVEADPQWRDHRVRVRTVGQSGAIRCGSLGFRRRGARAGASPAPRCGSTRGPTTSAPFSSRSPASTTSSTPRSRSRWPWSRGAIWRRCARRSRSSWGSIAASPSGFTRRASRSSTTTATIPPSSAPRSRRCAAATSARERRFRWESRRRREPPAPRGRLPTPPIFAHAPALRRLRRRALAGADKVVLPEIYAARDSVEDRASVSSEDLAANCASAGSTRRRSRRSSGRPRMCGKRGKMGMWS
mgnify:CR=1 FL=1